MTAALRFGAASMLAPFDYVSMIYASLIGWVVFGELPTTTIVIGAALVIFGGEQYGAGSSRDWAAKGTNLLGVKAVIAESFERIHRSNLVGMGVIPFEFTGGDTRRSLGLTGQETISIKGLSGDLKPLSEVPATITYADGTEKAIMLKCRIDTAIEIEYVENGGVLHYVLQNLAKVA